VIRSRVAWLTTVSSVDSYNIAQVEVNGLTNIGNQAETDPRQVTPLVVACVAMSDLPAALQILVDKSDITELLTRYMRAIDRGDIAALRACYAPGATEEHGGIYAGPAQGYIDTIERALTNPRMVATHTISNLLIEVDTDSGDAAFSEHYVLALTRVKADGVVSDSFVATRIMDNLVRRDGRWAIARRRLRFDWVHDIGPRPDQWVYGTLDPARLLHGAKFPDDIVFEGVASVSKSAAS
jgi:ketosteroid isomerase-like protein